MLATINVDNFFISFSPKNTSRVLKICLPLGASERSHGTRQNAHEGAVSSFQVPFYKGRTERGGNYKNYFLMSTVLSQKKIHKKFFCTFSLSKVSAEIGVYGYM